MQIKFKEIIKNLAKKHFSKIVEIRRYIHKHPELSFNEVKTTKYISQILSDVGISLQDKKFSKTGLVAYITGNKKDSKKVIALRADIDALPIVEQNIQDYKSTNEGVMHACGHDAHTASLIGTGMILNELKDEFSGTIKLIFQPAEEKPPGGAKNMIDNGILRNPTVINIFGQHVTPLIETGKVSFTKGKMLASNDNIYIKIKGKGGHAASPHLAVDSILIASHLVIALQQLVSRNAKPLTPSVLSLCSIRGGDATNILPEEVDIKGTFRTLDDTWRCIALEKMKNLACNMVESMGATCEFEIEQGYPCLENNEEVLEKVIQYSKEFLGEENVTFKEPSMGAEDFAYYLKEIPGCFYWLGSGNIQKDIDSYVHTPTFDIDENCLMTGSSLMAWITLNELYSN